MYNIPIHFIGHKDEENKTVVFVGFGKEYMVFLDENKIIEIY